MKNTKLLAILSIAAFTLTGCQRKCSKDEFINSAKKTENHEYATASVKVKGKVTNSLDEESKTYESNDTFEFEMKDGYWTFKENYSSEDSIDPKATIINSCYVVVSINVRDFVESDEVLSETESETLTFYNSPLALNCKAEFKDYELGNKDNKMVLNGNSDVTYTFNNKTGVVTKYNEKSDITIDMDVYGIKQKARTIADLMLEIKYTD